MTLASTIARWWKRLITWLAQKIFGGPTKTGKTSGRTPLLFGLSESYLADLGRIVATWSHIEERFLILFLSIVVMRGAPSGHLRDERVQRLMSDDLKTQVNLFKQRLDELELPEATLRKTVSTLDKLITLRRERDRVAHSVFNPTFEEDQKRFADGEAMS